MARRASMNRASVAARRAASAKRGTVFVVVDGRGQHALVRDTHRRDRHPEALERGPLGLVLACALPFLVLAALVGAPLAVAVRRLRRRPAPPAATGGEPA